MSGGLVNQVRGWGRGWKALVGVPGRVFGAGPLDGAAWSGDRWGRGRVFQRPPAFLTPPRPAFFLHSPPLSYVKLGQILSIRPDVLPPDVMVELARLQDKIKPFSSVEARAIIEADLGAPVDEIFSEFTAEPIAAASLAQVRVRMERGAWGGRGERASGEREAPGPLPMLTLSSSFLPQVYRARVRATGQEVAVKVQRPAALSTISKVCCCGMGGERERRERETG